ncbi:MAG: hypothetical protein IMF06_14315 [Proteobacteria bacterium]|nr:hypothetical protein [Pseudomonadota bacterium]
MKRLVLVVLLLLPFGAIAQDDYDFGTYWTVTAVDTKPGHFDGYLTDLKAGWRKSLDIQIKDGKVVSYQMFANVNPRDGEPNLWLLVEWKSGAAMLDTPKEYWDAHTKKLWGSQKKGEEEGMKRGELRTLMGDTLMREISFN